MVVVVEAEVVVAEAAECRPRYRGCTLHRPSSSSKAATPTCSGFTSLSAAEQSATKSSGVLTAWFGVTRNYVPPAIGVHIERPNDRLHPVPSDDRCSGRSSM